MLLVCALGLPVSSLLLSGRSSIVWFPEMRMSGFAPRAISRLFKGRHRTATLMDDDEVAAGVDMVDEGVRVK